MRQESQLTPLQQLYNPEDKRLLFLNTASRVDRNDEL